MTAEQLCSRIGAEDRERYFIETGLEYGYPPCCVFWFASVWKQLTDISGWDIDDYDDLSTEQMIACDTHMLYWSRFDLVQPRLEHMPCPACLLKARSESPARDPGAAASSTPLPG